MELKKENKSFPAFTEDIEKVACCSLAFSLIHVQQRQNRARAVLHPQQKSSELRQWHKAEPQGRCPTPLRAPETSMGLFWKSFSAFHSLCTGGASP